MATPAIPSPESLPIYFAPRAFDLAVEAGIVAVHYNLEDLDAVLAGAEAAFSGTLPEDPKFRAVVIRHARRGFRTGLPNDPPFDAASDTTAYAPAERLVNPTESGEVKTKAQITEGVGDGHILRIDTPAFSAGSLTKALAETWVMPPVEDDQVAASLGAWGRNFVSGVTGDRKRRVEFVKRISMERTGAVVLEGRTS